MKELFVVIVALIMMIAVVLVGLYSSDRAYQYGYKAGYHDAIKYTRQVIEEARKKHGIPEA